MRRLIVFALLVSCCGFAQAESQRLVFNRENRFPGDRKPEISLEAMFVEYNEDYMPLGADDVEEMRTSAMLRFGVTENLAVSARVPYRQIDSDILGNESGIGDVVLGIDLKVHEDIFKFPYVIPYAEAQLETGDEDDGLGLGENRYTFGLALGTIVEDVWSFTASAFYEVYADSDNIGGISGALVWDVSKTFSAQAEFKVTEYKGADEAEDYQAVLLGGLSYKPSTKTRLTVYGGAASHQVEDVLGGIRASLSF